ncbi:hypothetical protein Pelo_5294 [Pelomyxa schiedti]|nr:hypothetical protein Pelo_5294 [Pelomyxa schiedti]
MSDSGDQPRVQPIVSGVGADYGSRARSESATPPSSSTSTTITTRNEHPIIPGDAGCALFRSKNCGLVIPHSAVLCPKKAVAVEMYIFYRYPGDTSGYPVYVAKLNQEWDTTGYGLIGTSAGNIYFFVGGWSGLHTECVALPQNTWTHVCGVFDKGEVKIYLNGICEKTARNEEFREITHSSDSSIRLGYTKWRTYETVYGFTGFVKDVRIWNCARTPQEITNCLANGVSQDDFSKLLLWLPLNTNDGNFLADRSSHGHRVTQTGSPFMVNYAAAPQDSPKMPVHIPAEVASLERNNASRGRCLFLPSPDTGLLIPHHDSLNPDRTLTVECWLFCQDTSDLPTWAVYVSKLTEGWDMNGYGLIAQSAGTVIFFVNGWSGQVTPSYILTAGLWTHICGVFDNGQTQLYINGSRQSSVNGAAAIIPNVAPVHIGYCTYNNAPHPYGFTGSVQDVRIWRCARTPSQIMENMNVLSASDRRSPDLVCWLPLGSNDFPIIITKGSSQKGFGFFSNNGSVMFYVNSVETCVTAGLLPNSYWGHLCGVYDSGRITLYLNGDIVATTDAGSSPVTFGATELLKIGATKDWDGAGSTATFGCKGFIRDVRLWSCARTEQEIQSNMLRLSTSNHRSLEMWLPLGSNGCSGTDILDFVADRGPWHCTVEVTNSAEILPVPTPPSFVAWNIARLLFIAKFKNGDNEDCLMRDLPLDIIHRILFYL